MNRWSFLFIGACAAAFAFSVMNRQQWDRPDAALHACALFLFGAYVALVAYFGRDDRSDTSIVARERRARRDARRDAGEKLSLPAQTLLGVVLANTIAAMYSPTWPTWPTWSTFAVATAVGLVFGALAHRWVAGVPHFFD